jgi:hypothetical protein
MMGDWLNRTKLARVASDLREEADKLAHEIATENALLIIDCTAAEQDMDGETWFDIDSLALHRKVREEMASELRYLELRGLVKHHPTLDNLIQLTEEPWQRA